MVPALTFEDFDKQIRKKYANKSQVVGIILGRYDVENIKLNIEESYEYWNINTGSEFNVYWAGYGKYGNRDNHKVLNINNNKDNIFFDQDAFISFKNYLKENKIKYEDKFLLILCNVRYGKVYLNENILIDLEDNRKHNSQYPREQVEKIIDICKNKKDIKEIKNVIYINDILKRIKARGLISIFEISLRILG